MGKKAANPPPALDHDQAANVLRKEWAHVAACEAADPQSAFVDDKDLRRIIADSINHNQVTYRFCLPTQLLGKLCDPALDCLKLQRGKTSDPAAWDARSLASKVIAPFNAEQESVLGSSQDPYVSKPMRQPRMFRDDPSKKDVPGWNALVVLLEKVEASQDRGLVLKVFRQVLLEMMRRQRALSFSYPVPLRISLEDALGLMRSFLEEKSGGDRALALAAALFESIGRSFKLYARVKRGRINTADAAADQAADIECVDEKDALVMAVEVKDRLLSLSDIEGTLKKAKQRAVSEIFFTAPGVEAGARDAVADRARRSFASGQNLYVFDLIELARAVLAIGGEAMRVMFLSEVGRHLDEWNTQPRHRQAWQKLLSQF